MPSRTKTPSVARKKRHASRRRGALKKPTQAEKADRHVLYQKSVQDVESEIDFIDEIFEKTRGRKAALLREDFCGTANTSCEWVKRRKTNRAIGVDLDPDVLAWGREHNLAALPSEAQERLTLLNQDVMTVRPEPADTILAMNFSYWLFKERATLLAYFKAAHKALKSDGILFLDAYGGWEAHRTITEDRDCGGFTYVWDQAEFDPITSHMTCHIHFRFKDGSRLRKAFSYHWRLWSLPELRELLNEAGFRKATIYWEGADEETGEGDGDFQPVETAESDPGWICYIVAEK